MTFSIVARCAETGMFGVAVSSSSPAVAARCAYARSGVGAVASQNITDPTLGARTLDLMEQGSGAENAIATIKIESPHMAYRQVLAVDVQGQTAIHSGENTLGTWSAAADTDVACAGNLLSTEAIPQVMVDAFKDARGHLGDRLLAVMQAALAAGGEAGPVHSAGMLIVRDVPWPIADLRVDWAEEGPIGELQTLWTLYKPQLEDYVTRALDPTAAPSYGVPGDE